MRISILFLVIFSLSFTACEKTKEYSDIPEIKLLNVDNSYGADDLGNPGFHTLINFSFTDGDGDLGLSPADTTGDFSSSSEYYYNLKFEVFEKKNGAFIHRDDINHHFRFNNISKENTTNKVLKGEIETDLFFIKNRLTSDTVKLSFYIYDRALNKSNVEETQEIIYHE